MSEQTRNRSRPFTSAQARARAGQVALLCGTVVAALLGCAGDAGSNADGTAQRGAAAQAVRVDPVPAVWAFQNLNPPGGYGFDWRCPPSLRPQRLRMRALDPSTHGDCTAYRTLCQSPSGTRLVAIIRIGLDMFGINYDVEVWDPTGRRLYVGQVTCREGEFPFCLLELRSQVPGLAPGPGEPILALGLWREGQAYRPGKPLQPCWTPNYEETPAANPFVLDVIRWSNGDDDSWIERHRRITADPEVTVHWAEPTVEVPELLPLQRER